MSEPTFSSLTMTRKDRLTNCYGAEVSELLTGEKIPRHPDQVGLHSPYYRRLSITSEGDWFHSKLAKLRMLSDSGGLGYFDAQACTHVHRAVTTDGSGQELWAQTDGYTVLTGGWQGEIEAISRLQEWCRGHPKEAADVLEVPTDWLAPAMDAQFFTLKPSSEGLGDGNTPEFFFCVLRTLSEMMRFAKFHEKTPDLWVVSHRVLRYGS